MYWILWYKQIYESTSIYIFSRLKLFIVLSIELLGSVFVWLHHVLEGSPAFNQSQMSLQGHQNLWCLWCSHPRHRHNSGSKMLLQTFDALASRPQGKTGNINADCRLSISALPETPWRISKVLQIHSIRLWVEMGGCRARMETVPCLREQVSVGYRAPMKRHRCVFRAPPSLIALLWRLTDD